MVRTLSSWAKRGHLTGDENASTRATLRSIARQADAAEHSGQIGVMNANSVSQVLRALNEFTHMHAPPPTPVVDPRDANLEARALSIIDGIADSA